MDAQAEKRTDTDDRIKAIAADIFGIDAAGIELSMGPDDIDRWDSLNHLRLITELENTFEVRLSMKQIQQIRSLNDLASFAVKESA